jgi:polar amino acid transport system substrate-binding protein
MKKNYYLILGLILIVLAIVLISSIYKKSLIVVVGTNTPPFEFYEGTELVGIDIEFLERVFSKMDIEYEILLMDWSEALTTMEDGKADIILGAGYSPLREKFISYREEHKTENIPEDTLWISGEVYFYKKNSNYNLSSFESIKKNNYRVGIVRDYLYFDELFDQNLNFFVYPNVNDLIMALINEEIDTAIIDSLEGHSLLTQLNLNKEIISKGKPLSIGSNLLLFQKKYDNPKYAPIKKQFYEELIRLKEEENLHEILYEKYTGVNFTETYWGFFE